MNWWCHATNCPARAGLLSVSQLRQSGILWRQLKTFLFALGTTRRSNWEIMIMRCINLLFYLLALLKPLCHDSTIQAAFLCSSATAKNRRKPQIYRKEREGTVYWPQSKRNPSADKNIGRTAGNRGRTLCSILLYCLICRCLCCLLWRDKR